MRYDLLYSLIIAFAGSFLFLLVDRHDPNAPGRPTVRNFGVLKAVKRAAEGSRTYPKCWPPCGSCSSWKASSANSRSRLSIRR
jgi:hypothetical protein